jgi:C1A family cysteine protease
VATKNHRLASLRHALDRVISELRTILEALLRILPIGRRAARPRWVLAPLNLDFLAYQARRDAGMPVPELTPAMMTRRDIAVVGGHVEPPPPQPPLVDGICAFPSSFDRRALGAVTPLWPTGKGCGTCWTVAAMSSLESSFAPGQLNDFSEAHMQLENGAFALDPKASCLLGGNCDLAAFYLADWRGPVNEEDFDPWKVDAASPPEVVKHVQNIWFPPDRTGPLDNCWIKLFVMHIGGVYSSISLGWGTRYSEDEETYYNPYDTSIHAVAIVGWDDRFDRTKFYCDYPALSEAQRVPPGDGAWIVKDHTAKSGYKYVSYYDISIGTSLACYTGEPVGNYTGIYQYDLGVTEALTYLPDPLKPQEEIWALTDTHGHALYQGNIFTAASDESLTAVGFYEWVGPETDYEILVYLDPDNGPVRITGAHAAKVSVSPILRGYFTVPLPKPVPVAKGQRFGVVLKGRPRDGGLPKPIPIDAPHGSVKTGKAHPGRSFVSTDGVMWEDLTSVKSGAKLCIKAFTKEPLHVQAGLHGNVMEWVLRNDGPTSIRLQPVARRYRETQDGFEPFGDDVLAEAYEHAGGARRRVADGWVDVSPRSNVTAFSAPAAVAEADRILYNAYRHDAASDSVIVPDVWKYLLALVDQPPVVVSTDPASGEHVNHLGLSAIYATFNCAIKLGPASGSIVVTSPDESKMTISSAQGQKLRIVLATPLGSHELGGTLWTVNIPATAVLETALGNPMTQDYSWTFTVTGVD